MVPHPRTGEGLAVLGVLTLIALEVVALAVGPTRDRPTI
jgi:hypothetical protein